MGGAAAIIAWPVIVRWQRLLPGCRGGTSTLWPPATASPVSLGPAAAPSSCAAQRTRSRPLGGRPLLPQRCSTLSTSTERRELQEQRLQAPTSFLSPTCHLQPTCDTGNAAVMAAPPAKLLQGRWCVVTGASSGIGRGLAQAFAREGASLVVSARRVAALEEVGGGHAGAATCWLGASDQQQAVR